MLTTSEHSDRMRSTDRDVLATVIDQHAAVATTAAPGGRFRIRLAGPDIGDEEARAVAAVLGSGMLTNGPRTAEFEERFARRHGTEHGVAFASGTVALTAILRGLGLGPGDEVVVPSMSFISTATAVLHAGAEVVFADVEPDTLTLDPADVERRLGARTRAVIAVHYGGQAADMAGLREVADRGGVHLIEDAAEAHGASYRGTPVGGLGAAGMFSFTPTKNITTGEGGLVTTDDGALAGRLRLLRNHGQVAPYQYALLGHNWRLTEMQAAMGIVQLAKLDRIIERKQRNALRLASILSRSERIHPPLVATDRTHSFMLYTVRIRGARDRAHNALLGAGIECRVCFPPIHRQPVFARGHEVLPVTEQATGEILSLPFHPTLSAAEIDEIGERLLAAVDG